ncbi:MAG: 2-dehydropantoate 2-reductase [Desulfobacteraceae bacterium]|nr:2-dehydropantoate 2-reductase [Desulfobacteraceae bacterium]
MNVGIIGCGSLGGVLADRLSRTKDIRVSVIVKNSAVKQMISDRGIMVRDKKNISRSYPEVADQLSDISMPLDAVILATKCNTLIQSAESVLPYISEQGFFITTQNGIAALDLADRLGKQKVIPGVVLWGSSMRSYGEYDITSHGPFIIGEVGGEKSAQIQNAAALLSNIFPVKLSDNITGVLWAKLFITATFTSLGAVTGLRFGELAGSLKIRRLILKIGGEIAELAKSMNIETGTLGGLNIKRVMKKGGYPNILKHLFIYLIGYKSAKTTSSMLASLEQKKKTEIDFVNGLVADFGKKANVPVKYNQTVADIILKMENNLLTPGIKNIEILENICPGTYQLNK